MCTKQSGQFLDIQIASMNEMLVFFVKDFEKYWGENHLLRSAKLPTILKGVGTQIIIFWSISIFLPAKTLYRLVLVMRITFVQIFTYNLLLVMLQLLIQGQNIMIFTGEIITGEIRQYFRLDSFISFFLDHIVYF